MIIIDFFIIQEKYYRVNDIHNLVNDKLGAPQCERPSFEDIETQYQSYRASCKPLTTKERIDNAGKGCIAPADGKPKRSVIKVVEYATSNDKKSEPTQIPTPTPSPTASSISSTKSIPTPLIFPKADDYIIINKHTAINIIKVIIILFIIIISYIVFKNVLLNNKKQK